MVVSPWSIEARCFAILKWWRANLEMSQRRQADEEQAADSLKTSARRWRTRREDEERWQELRGVRITRMREDYFLTPAKIERRETKWGDNMKKVRGVKQRMRGVRVRENENDAKWCWGWERWAYNPGSFKYLLRTYCCGSCQKLQQYVWTNNQKNSVETILPRFSAETAAIWFFFFLRDILLHMGKIVAISPQQ